MLQISLPSSKYRHILFGLLGRGGTGSSSGGGRGLGSLLGGGGRSGSGALGTQQGAGTAQGSLAQVPPVPVAVDDVLQLLEGAAWLVLQRHLHGGLGRLGLENEGERGVLVRILSGYGRRRGDGLDGFWHRISIG